MHNLFFSILNNEISINLLIGFFYSAIIGVTILKLTYMLDNKKGLNSLSVDLTRLTFVLTAIYHPINKISELNGPEYRKFFANILDNIEIKKDEIKTVNEFIIFDQIPLLPPLNEYLIEKFNEGINEMFETNKINSLATSKFKKKKLDSRIKNMEKKCEDLFKQSDKQKKDFILKNNAFVLQYEDINRRIMRVNDMLEYYRRLTFEIIGIDIIQLTSGNISTENKIKVFKSCLDSLINECGELKKSLDLLGDTVAQNKIVLGIDITKNQKLINHSLRIFTITIIICFILLLIA